MADLNGRDFKALRRLSNKADMTLANVGETCERVPVSSLAALLASGKIERVERWSADVDREDEGHV